MNSDFQYRLEQARLTPLECILDAYELSPVTAGGITRYEGEKVDIIIAGAGVWFDNVASVGGRGPVDLVLHLQGVDPRTATPEQRQGAVNWIEFFEFGTSPADTVKNESSFQQEAARLAIRDDDRWPIARRHLIDACRVPSTVVDILHGENQLYASYAEHQPEVTDLCFVRRDLDGIAQGATLQSTVDPRAALRSIGSQDAWFSLGDPKSNRFILTESPIDAISYLTLNRPEDASILAITSKEVPVALLEKAHARNWYVIVAFGNAPSAHEGFVRCRQDWLTHFGTNWLPRRIAPLGSTWNEDLRAAKTLSRDHKW